MMRLLVLTLVVGVAVSLPACNEGDYCGRVEPTDPLSRVEPADPLTRVEPVKTVDFPTLTENEDEGKVAPVHRQARQCPFPCTG